MSNNKPSNLFKESLPNTVKGFFVGIGGIAPGLSGSVLLVIFGLYQKTINAIGTLFKNFKENLKFLIPLAIGMLCGVVAFSNLVKYLLTDFEIFTRFAFFGLVVGTLPLLYKEVKKEGFKPAYYLIMLASSAFGAWFFYFRGESFASIQNPGFFSSIGLGLAVAGSYIVPGIDSAALLNAFGLYDIWLEITSFEGGLSGINWSVVVPVVIGLGVGVLGISFLMNKLLSKFYTVTYSVIFGFFLTVIPGVFRGESGSFIQIPSTSTADFYIACAIAFLGLFVSLYFGDMENNNKKIKKLFKK